MNHALIYINGDKKVVYVDDSTNGTWVHMAYGFKLMLDEDQEIRFGQHEVYKFMGR